MVREWRWQALISGMVNYRSKYIQNLSKMSEYFKYLLKIDVEYG